MATFKTITANDIQTTQSSLNQLVDVIQEDISGSYEVQDSSIVIVVEKQ